MEYIKNPCTNCPRIGCGAFHDKCEEYLEYVEERRRVSDDKCNSKRYKWQNSYERMNYPRSTSTPRINKRGKKRG